VIPRGRIWQVVDCIDLHTMVDDETFEVRLRQWIYWDWVDGELVCQGWTMHRNPDVYVEKIGEYYYLRFSYIKARSYREYWNCYDPEVLNRTVWPDKLRRIRKHEEPSRGEEGRQVRGQLAKSGRWDWLRKLWPRKQRGRERV